VWCSCHLYYILESWLLQAWIHSLLSCHYTENAVILLDSV
jgi:hypothetical protein